MAARNSNECSGGPWLITALLEPHQQFGLELVTPDGWTLLVNGRERLGSTLVAIPAALIGATADSLQVDGDEFIVRVEIDIIQPSIYSIPPQTVAPTPIGKGLSLRSAVVEDGTIVIMLNITRGDLGAVAEYQVDLKGLEVEIGDLPNVTEKPDVESMAMLITGPRFLVLGAEASSGDLELATGAAVVGRPPDSFEPAQEPDAVVTDSNFYQSAVFVLLFLLVLSWGGVLIWRRRNVGPPG